VTALAWSLFVAMSARGQTVAVQTEVVGGAVSESALQSGLWHALQERFGHEPLLLSGEVDDAVDTMVEHHLTTLYRVELSWDRELFLVPEGQAAAQAPTVAITEYTLERGILRPTDEWTTWGAGAVYQVAEPGVERGPLVSLPEIAVQDTLFTAVSPMSRPSWRGEPADLVRVPVVVAADEEYRAFYQGGWYEAVGARVERASALLAQAGLKLEIVGYERWTSPDGLEGMSGLLRHLAQTERTEPNALRIGFTQQTRLELSGVYEAEDVGRAHQPGRDVVIADQAAPPQHQPMWDVADEGVAVAHEVLHALGAPHLNHQNFVMSETKGAMVHVIAPSSRRIARTAAVTRYAHWDAVVALQALGQTAEGYLKDPDLQVDYIVQNLALGPGAPDPDRASPQRLSALTNLAVGRYYLELATDDPTNASALRERAIAHGSAALVERTAGALELLEALQVVESKAAESLLGLCRRNTMGPWSVDCPTE